MRAEKPAGQDPKPGREARVGAILTKGRTPALGPARLSKDRLAAIFCEGSPAEAGDGSIFVEG